MKFTVRNEKLNVDNIQIGGLEQSALVLIGDSEFIGCSSVFDTPKDSFIVSPQIQLIRSSPIVFSDQTEKEIQE